MTDPPVAARAKSLGIHVFQPPTLKDDAVVTRLARARADVFVVVAYGRILAQRVLDLPRLGSLNVHGSLLPRWRGASPVQAAILAGDPVTGVSIMRMDAGMDTGPVYATREARIGEEETAEELGGRLSQIGADLLEETLYFLEGEEGKAGTAAPRGTAGAGATTGRAPSQKIFFPPHPQNPSLATTCPKISREDARVDWTRPALELVRRSRAFTPWPGLFTIRRNARLKLFHVSLEAEGEVREGAEGPSPGTILEAEPAPRRRVRRRGGLDRDAAGRGQQRAARGRVRARRARRARRALGLMADSRPVRERALGVLVRVARDGAHAAPLAGRARARSAAA